MALLDPTFSHYLFFFNIFTSCINTIKVHRFLTEQYSLAPDYWKGIELQRALDVDKAKNAEKKKC